MPGLVVAGLGLGLAMVALTVGAVPGSRPDAPAEGGVASGLYNTALQVGGALGVAGLAAVAEARARALAPALSDAAALTSGRQLALAVAAVALLAGAGLALALPARTGRE